VRKALALSCAILAVAACRGAASTPSEPAPVDSSRAPQLTNAAVDASVVSAMGTLGTSSVDAGSTRAHVAPPKAGEVIEIPAGSFMANSLPGDEGRDPTIEPLPTEVKLNAFKIDALPYPNDPAQTVKTGVSRAEAQKLCADKGARLCTELEWERACKGPEGDMHASGGAWDRDCDENPAACASGFGVRGLGVLREWTSSQILSAVDGIPPAPAVRGAGTSHLDGGLPYPGAHRCARRSRGAEGRVATDLTFRCCYGEPNQAALPAVELKPGYRRTTITAGQLAKIFAGIPELSKLGPEIRLFEQGDINTVLNRSNASANGIQFSVAPMLWSPEPGAEYLVAVGRGKAHGFIVALHVLPNDRYRIASYLLLLNDPAPLALAYNVHNRKELLWSSCWGCAGEQGSFGVREDHHVVIVQH
jgi:formylglycine-generating enzyme required for sulfatase activity